MALPPAEKVSVLIIGSGFSGLCMGIRLKRAGLGDFAILERAGDLGGTWRDNSYPGCACDVESHLYSYSFEPNPLWSRQYAPRAEIYAYLQGCAKKYELGPHLRFGADMVEARFDDATSSWTVTTRDGRRFQGSVLVSGTGALSNPSVPELLGLSSFQGTTFHSARWDHGYDLRGKRVAVIGSGASAIQFVPQIAGQVARLDYYQRTPAWVLPKPDWQRRPWELGLSARRPLLQRLFRYAIYWLLELRVLGFVLYPRLMRGLEWLGRLWIRRSIRDPALREKITPRYSAGCKRLLLSNDYYPALARSNVEVITEGIREVRPHGIVTTDGREREVDAIVFGTGFKVQDPVPRGTIFGVQGRDLMDAWPMGPEAYLGLTVSGFPNLFFLMGPNTALGHSSVIYMIEAQVDYVMGALQEMADKNLERIEVREEIQAAFNANLQRKLKTTVWGSGCNSWYLNPSGRNTTLWPGFTFDYRRRTRSFDPSCYSVQGLSSSAPVVEAESEASLTVRRA